MTPAEPETRVTNVRHLVVAVAVLMAVILYLDRFCVSFAERYIKEDLGLSEFEMAVFISGFFLAYALGQVPSGWLGDQLGSRGVLALYIVSWSLFTVMIGMAAGFAMLLAMRLGCGLSQAGAYPTAGSILSRWVPFSSRGFASGMVALGGRLGAVIAPVLTAYLMVLFVPLSTSATLNERSILDGPALCERLSPVDGSVATDNGTSIEQRINQGLPNEAQSIVAKYGPLYREYKRALLEHSRRIANPAKSSVAGTERDDQNLASGEPNRLTCEPRELEALAAGLNSLLDDRDLFSPEDFEQLKSAESQALQLQARRSAGESLSAAETARLNRLFLEGLFPSQIGKLYVKGWRPVLLVYGIAGIAVAGVFWFCFRNSPAEHPWCSAAERTLIEGQTVAASGLPSAEPTKLPIREILHSVSLWLSSVSQFATNVAWLFFVTYLPRYLMEIHDVPILKRSWMVAIPPVAGIAGMFLGGHLTDSLVRRIGLRWGRALPMALTRFFAAATYLACLWIDSPWPATIAFAIGFFFVDLGVSATWAFMQDVGGKHVGSILGWANMWGNFGAAAAPFLYTYVLGESPQAADWNTMFVVCALMFVVSGLAAVGINATVPIAAKLAGPPCEAVD